MHNGIDAIGPYFRQEKGYWIVTNMDGCDIATFDTREKARALLAFLYGLDDPDNWELKCVNPLIQP